MIYVRMDLFIFISELKKYIYKLRKSLKIVRGILLYLKVFISCFLYVIEFFYSVIEFENFMKYFVFILI